MLVIGESLVDVVVRPDGSATERPGGSPMNVAVGLARLGHAVTLATWLGEDARGALVLEHLRASGVTLAPGSTDAVRTSTATARLRADGGADYAFDLDGRLPPLPGGAPSWVHAGSIAAVLPPGGTQVLDAVHRLRGTALISYDPNARPDIMGDGAREIVEQFVRLADVAKASDEDLAWLYPGEAVADVAARWLEQGPALVVVTRGADGALAATKTGRVAVPAEKVPVVDTIGAGDAFQAALLHGLAGLGYRGAGSREKLGGIAEADLRGVLTLASRAAAITVGRPGADPPTGAELRESLNHDVADADNVQAAWTVEVRQRISASLAAASR